MSKRNSVILRLSINGALAAVFYVLTFLSIRIGNDFKLTFDSLAVVISGVFFGPVDGFAVGFIGAFLEQMTGPYGLTPTTILWVLAPALRGLVVGLGAKLFKEKMSVRHIIRKPLVYFIVCAVAAIVTSVANTIAMYIDSKLYNYFNPMNYVLFGYFGLRIVLGLATAMITAVAALPILGALNRANVVPNTMVCKNADGSKQTDVTADDRENKV